MMVIVFVVVMVLGLCSDGEIVVQVALVMVLVVIMVLLWCLLMLMGRNDDVCKVLHYVASCPCVPFRVFVLFCVSSLFFRFPLCCIAYCILSDAIKYCAALRWFVFRCVVLVSFIGLSYREVLVCLQLFFCVVLQSCCVELLFLLHMGCVPLNCKRSRFVLCRAALLCVVLCCVTLLFCVVLLRGTGPWPPPPPFVNKYGRRCWNSGIMERGRGEGRREGGWRERGVDCVSFCSSFMGSPLNVEGIFSPSTCIVGKCAYREQTFRIRIHMSSVLAGSFSNQVPPTIFFFSTK